MIEQTNNPFEFQCYPPEKFDTENYLRIYFFQQAAWLTNLANRITMRPTLLKFSGIYLLKESCLANILAAIIICFFTQLFRIGKDFLPSTFTWRIFSLRIGSICIKQNKTKHSKYDLSSTK